MASYIVKGKITDQKGQAQSGLIVRASDLDFNNENALGRPR